jgi:hypothetical protein
MFAKSRKGNPYEEATVNWKIIVYSTKLFNSLPTPKCRAQSKVLTSYRHNTSTLKTEAAASSETLVITCDIAPCCNPKHHNLNKTGNDESHKVVYKTSSGIHSSLFYKIL